MVAVRGLPIEVDLALTQDDARTLASGKASQRGAKDNRNLYLVGSPLLLHAAQAVKCAGLSCEPIACCVKFPEEGCP